MARSTRKKTSAKSARTATAPAAKSVAKAVPKVPAAQSIAESESSAEPKAEELAPADLFKRADLLTAVSARSALAKSDLRAVIELVLEEMGGALDAGHDLALPPLGRVKIQRRKDGDGAEVLTLRLRRKTADSASEPA